MKSVSWQRDEEKGFSVYNMTVEDDHDYLAGTLGGGVWVHNCPGNWHHVATDKNEIAGEQWTLRLKPLFDRHGVSMQDENNLVFLDPHKGPHPDEYHDWVFNSLESAENREDFISRLQNIKEILTNNPNIVNHGPYPPL